METAKVDIRKLQLLNDRINQCIDALNQVRLSVHGLSHTSPQTAGLPYAGMTGIPGISPVSPFSAGAGAGFPGTFGQFGAFGLSHTNPESLENYPRPTWADPYLAARVAQTFPYVQFNIPPVVSLY